MMFAFRVFPLSILDTFSGEAYFVVSIWPLLITALKI